MNMAMSGMLNSRPEMAVFNQMMNGKGPQEQFNTIVNMAKSNGFDVDKKIFTAADLKSLGILK